MPTILPLFGPHDKTEQEYQQDLAECHEYAEQVSKGEAMKTGAVNAGVFGAAGGAAKATQDQSYVLRRCMAGKGYDVLDLRS